MIDAHLPTGREFQRDFPRIKNRLKACDTLASVSCQIPAFESSKLMRRRDRVRDAIARQCATNRQRIIQRRRTIIDAGKDVAMDVDRLLGGESREAITLDRGEYEWLAGRHASVA